MIADFPQPMASASLSYAGDIRTILISSKPDDEDDLLSLAFARDGSQQKSVVREARTAIRGCGEPAGSSIVNL